MKNVTVDKKKKSVKLSFNNCFYRQDFIDQAIRDFSEICDIKKEEDIICLKSKKEEKIDLKTVGYKFYNYVLVPMKNS